jgi:hypothetical protein
LVFLNQEVDRIIQSGVLGRSPVYQRLLCYLRDTTLQGKLPREIDIAVDVFDRSHFDSSADSTVRVYLHNLRQKLAGYYEGSGAGQEQILQIPKGEYRLLVTTRRPAAQARSHSNSLSVSRVGLAASMVAALTIGWLASNWMASEGEYESAASTELWQPLLHSDRPLVIVLGDYYIFAEIGEYGEIQRLIRDFRIDSREVLDDNFENSTMSRTTYRDIRLSYLPVGIGTALADVLSVIDPGNRRIVIIPQSNLDIQTVQSSDIVYIGYLSGLGLLKDFVFASSNFSLGDTYDELVNRDSGETYVSEAGSPEDPAGDYVDYGFLSTFPGPSGNQILIVAGMRDEGLMQMAVTLKSGESIARLVEQIPGKAAGEGMEALYRVRGMHRMNIASRLVFASTLQQADIWVDSPDFRAAAHARSSSDDAGR